MGRELIVDRLDITRHGNIIKGFDDYYLCGRTEFTNCISQYFYNQNVCFLILDNSAKFTRQSLHVVDNYRYASEKEFDDDFGVASLDSIKRECTYYIEKDELYLKDLNERLEDARIARQNAPNVETFEDYSQYIEELRDFIDHYCEEAKLFLQYLIEVEEDIKNNPLENAESYIIIELSE